MDKNQLLNELIGLGFEEKMVKYVLPDVDNVDSAINMILALQESQNPPQQQPQVQQGLFANIDQIPFNIDFSKILPPAEYYTNRRYKMICMVRMDLGMGIGKIAAQTGHAVLGAYKQLENSAQGKEVLKSWEDSGQAKIVLKCEGLQQMRDLEQEARKAGLNTYTVQDAGRTQVEPGSYTVCAIGPGDSEVIDSVTRHLKLL